MEGETSNFVKPNKLFDSINNPTTLNNLLKEGPKKSTLLDDVKKQLKEYTPQESSQFLKTLLTSLASDDSEHSQDKRDVLIEILPLIDLSSLKSEELLDLYEESLSLLTPESDPLGTVFSIIEAGKIMAPYFPSSPETEKRITAYFEGLKWPLHVERDYRHIIQKELSDLFKQIPLEPSKRVDKDIEDDRELDINANLQDMLILIPDELHLSKDIREKLSKLFNEYQQCERLFHFIEDTNDPTTVEPEELEVYYYERHKEIFELFFKSKNPGELIAKNFSGSASTRSSVMPIDSIIHSPDYVFFNLGLGEELTEEKWDLPDGQPAFMAFVLKPEAMHMPDLRAFNAADTADFTEIFLDWENVSRLILDVDTLNQLRRELLLRLGPDGGFYTSDTSPSTSKYTVGSYHTVYDTREVKIPERVPSQLVEAIIFNNDNDLEVLKPFLNTKIGDTPLKDIVYTVESYKKAYKDRYRKARIIREQIKEVIKVVVDKQNIPPDLSSLPK